jgi:DNA-binding SARP family transcriptional activator
VRLVVLGPVEAIVNERPVRIDRAQRRALLAYLLLRANQTVTADQLVDALWGAKPPATAKTQVFAAVSAIRRALRTVGCDPVMRTPGGYRLTATKDQLDLLAFGQHVDQAHQHAAQRDLDLAVLALRSGLALWSGKPLTGVSGAFVESAQAGLEEQRLVALEMLFELELALGNHQGVVAEVSDLAAANPFRERLIGHLMLALYRSGRPADALATYRRTRQALSEELGIDPTSELVTLHKRILENDGGLSVPDPSGMSLINPDRRFLPRDIPDFTGRSADLEQLDAMAMTTPGAAHAVVISAVAGVGGVGKTALAVRWAHRVAPRFPDGQLYLNLRGYDDRRPLRPIEALGAFLRALGVPHERIPGDLDEASALFRATLADQRVLLFLDNARSVEQVRPLLPASPRTLVLITSRDALGGLIARDGARRLDVDLLPLTDSVDLLARILGPDRVASDSRATQDLVAACGHLPLAIRIAAANLAARPSLNVASYLAEIVEGRRLESLWVDGDPQSSVQVIFDQSYRCLTASQQRAFRLLGLVPGPDFTVEAAARLADEQIDQTDVLLRTLIDAHLVLEHRPGRFTMHDLIREYARSRANATDLTRERTDALRRLMAWTVSNADAAVQRLYPVSVKLPATGQPSDFATPTEAKAWLNAELANLVAIVETGAALGFPDAVWRIAFICRIFFNAILERQAMLAMGKAALDAARLAGETQGLAASELVMARAYTVNGHDDRCLPHAQRCLELARSIGWLDLEIDGHNALSVHHLMAGDLRIAADHARIAFDHSMSVGVVPLQYLGKLGLINMLMGSLRTASDYFEQTLDSENHQVGYNRAITLLNLAEVRTLQGRLGEAEQCLKQAIGLLEEAGNSHVKALAKADMAAILYDLGRHQEGWDLMAEARTALEDSTDALARTQMSYQHGKMLIAAGRRSDGMTVLQAALDLARTLGNRYPATQIMIAIARAHAASNQDEAAVLCAQALDAARKGQFRLLEGQSLTAAAIVHLAAGRRAEAQHAARTALRIHEETGHEPGRLETRRLLDDVVR